MPVSSFFGLNTALRGLTAHQRALDVTGHNVANAATEGYSRQKAVMTSADPLEIGANGAFGIAQLGAGVDVTAFARLRDTFADLQYRAQNMSLGQHTTNAELIGQAELMLSEPSDTGIGELLNKFWNAWDDLSNHPSNPATRQAVINQASLLTDRLKSLSSSLTQVRTEAATQYAQITGPNGDVLALANEISQYNMAIASITGSGGQPNDLLDRRDAALDKLSSLAKVSVTALPTGAVRVDFGDAATPLVDGTTVTWPQALTDAAGGKLGALIKLSDTTAAGTVTSYINELDAFVAQLATDVNTVHGTPFFTGTTAGTITVAADATTLRATAAAAPVPAGANDIALAMATLRGGATDKLYANLVARIGGDARAGEQLANTAKALVDSANARRESVAGVSMDEEMANMIRFQRGYQASARTMSTMDEMLDVLINRTGRVGI
jgi:flagellar hook-associated protein 1 FlgK